MRVLVVLLGLMLSGQVGWAADPRPDLAQLSRAGWIMGPGDASYPVNPSWDMPRRIMESVTGWDGIINRMAGVLCSTELNKSILLVGEPSEMYRYIFARMASRAVAARCPEMWHVEVDISKIEAGHHYVGDVDQYWQDYILEPSERRSVILYFSSLNHLIGMGTSMNDDTGIEAKYVEDFKAGRIRTVAFIDRFNYNTAAASKDAYVLWGFKEKIIIPALSEADTLKMVTAFLQVAKPNLILSEKEATYMIRSLGFYAPNRDEPDRSLATVEYLIRKFGNTTTPYTLTHEDIRVAVMTMAQVPEWLISRNYRIISELRERLDRDVVGVSEAKRDIERLAKIGYVAGRTDEKPVATNLFVGPTGTGKSFIAKKVAEVLGMKLITFDMTAYKNPNEVQAFQGILARNLINYPYAVYLFEEIDKATIEILDLLYFMMDEGIFYDETQRPLFARGAFVLMTTNAASDVIIREKSNPELKKLVNAELQKAFRSSFLNRFDAVSLFLPFTDAEFLRLSQIMTQKKFALIKQQMDWTVSADSGTIEYIARYGKSDIFGARPMERLVENVIGVGIAEYQMQQAPILEGATIAIAKLGPTHEFSIQVDAKTPLTFVVDPSNNNGGLMRSLWDLPSNMGLMKLFEANRIYTD